jgi:outer membrane protein assembly factor BamB
MSYNSKIVVLFILLVLIGACTNQNTDQNRQESDKIQEDWPIFRGSTNLAAVTQAALPEQPQILWAFKTEYEIKSSPIIASGMVFIGSNDGFVYAIDLKTGQKEWSFNTEDDVEAAPLYFDHKIFVGSLGGFFYALNANDGKLIWQYETEGQIHGSANYVKLSETNDGLVMVGSYDNLMYGFEAKTGKLNWTYETEYFINGSPASSDELAVFGGCDEVVHIISVRDGTKIGQVEAGAYIAGSAAMFGKKAYIGHYGEKLIAIDLEKKRVEWEYGSEKNGAPFFSSPAVNNDVVIIGSRDRLVHCVDRKTGMKRWTFRTHDEVDSSPVICQNKVIVGSNDGRLYSLDLGNGTQLWSYEVGAAITGSPAVCTGKIIIGADDGFVYCFGEKE